ncbi:MAG: hypothetical protein WBX25_24935 [Rhodomicrobium sp.]
MMQPASERFSTTLFAVPFADVTISSTASAWDLVTLTAPSSGRVEIREIRLGQKSTNTANNQQVDVQMFTGTVSSSLGGAAITPVNFKRWPAAPVAGTAAVGPSSAAASTTGATLAYADTTDYSGQQRAEGMSPASFQGARLVGQSASP